MMILPIAFVLQSSSAVAADVQCQQARIIKTDALAVELCELSEGIQLGQISDPKTGISFLAKADSLFRLTLRRTNGSFEVVSSSTGWGSLQIHSGSAHSLQFVMSKRTDFPGLSVEGSIELRGSLAYAKLQSVSTPGDAKLAATHFPYMNLSKIGASGADDYFHFPRGSGVVKRDPFAAAPKLDLLGYPSGYSSYQMMGMYDAQTGIYLATHDPQANYKFFRLSNESDYLVYDVKWMSPVSHGAENSVHKLDGEIVFGVVQGDWFDAAQIYRRWAEQNAPWVVEARSRKSLMQDLDVWFIGAGEEYSIYHDRMAQFAKQVGSREDMPNLGYHWYSWHFHPFDQKLPEYFPPKPGFEQGINKLQKSGIAVMPYINAHVWDAKLESYATQGLRNAIKNHDQSVIKFSSNQTAELIRMCAAAPPWQAKLAEIMTELNSYRPSGIYLDQLAGVPPYSCLDESHGHTLGGGDWWINQGVLPTFRRFRESLSGEKVFLTSEWATEAYLGVTDGMLTSYFQQQDQAPIFSAIYGQSVPGFGRFHDQKQHPDDAIAFRMKQSQAFVYGNQLGWSSLYVLDKPDMRDYLMRLTQLRSIARKISGFTEFRRPLVPMTKVPVLSANWRYYWRDLQITDSAVQMSAWSRSSGPGVVMMLANSSKERIELDLDWRFLKEIEAAQSFRKRVFSESGLVREDLVMRKDLLQADLSGESAQVWELIPVEVRDEKQ
jgi:hypothetical protein